MARHSVKIERQVTPVHNFAIDPHNAPWWLVPAFWLAAAEAEPSWYALHDRGKRHVADISWAAEGEPTILDAKNIADDVFEPRAAFSCMPGRGAWTEVACEPEVVDRHPSDGTMWRLKRRARRKNSRKHWERRLEELRAVFERDWDTLPSERRPVPTHSLDDGSF